MPEFSIAERLLYSTAKIEAVKDGKLISTGTGFFMQFGKTEENFFPTIVTNRHVLELADRIDIICHVDDAGKPSGSFIRFQIQIAPGSYVTHDDSDIDLCAVPISDLMRQASEAGTPFFAQWLDVGLIPCDEDWDYFDAIEDVTMIGCPNGISDEVNNLPVARRGITASPLSKRYNGKNEFLVDMACFPGSSGSPIFIYDRNGFLDRRENTYKLGQQRIILVGVLYAGPQITNTGQLVLNKSPQVFVSAMMHLGNAIRSSALKELDAQFRERVAV